MTHLNQCYYPLMIYLSCIHIFWIWNFWIENFWIMSWWICEESKLQNYLCARCWWPFLFGWTRASLCAMFLFEPFFFVVCLMFCRMLIVECWRKLSVRFRQATFFIRSKLQLFPTRLILVGKVFFSERENYCV